MFCDEGLKYHLRVPLAGKIMLLGEPVFRQEGKVLLHISGLTSLFLKVS